MSNKGVLGNACNKNDQVITKEMASLDEAGVVELKNEMEKSINVSVTGFEIGTEPFTLT